MSSNPSHLLIAGVGMLFFGSLATAAPPADPWALVPSPAGCYQGKDPFTDAVNEVIDRLQQEIDEQQSTNNDLSQQAAESAEEDPLAAARKIQELAAKDPQAVIAMLQKQQAAAANVTQSVQQEVTEGPERQAALDKLIADYRAAYQDMYSQQVEAKVDALPTVEGEGGATIAPSAVSQLTAINRQATAAYEQLCAKWFRPGPFKAWLDEYRGFLVNDRTRRGDDLAEQEKQALTVRGVDATEYRSTAAMEAARDYAKRLQQVYAERLDQPIDLERTYGLKN